MSGLEPGRPVTLSRIPLRLLSRLPAEAQEAINAIVGKPVIFGGFKCGQMVLEFVDREGDGHTIWVEPSFLRHTILLRTEP